MFMQQAFTAAEACPVPVIAAVHGPCIGAGVDLITACDVRLCSADAVFSVREVALSLAADVGTLARLAKVAGNASLISELCFTGRDFDARTALRMGLVSREVQGSGPQVRDAAIELARAIAAMSPLAVAGTKANLIYARDHSVSDSLGYVATWNGAALQSRDLATSALARISKTKPAFSRL